MVPLVVVASIGLVIFIMIDVSKNRDKLQYVYIPAPTIGSVKPPSLQQIGPITNIVGSPWMGGGSSPYSSWSYGMN